MLALALVLGLGACKGESDNGSAAGGAEGGAQAEGDAKVITIDGSSTVFPINEAMAEEFQAKSDARVTIGVSGTGGGFKKFCRQEVDVIGASRPITDAEAKSCQETGVEFIELPVAYDGVTVVVHPDNDWVDAMTVAELQKLWEPAAQGKIKKWNQIREGWPDKEIHLFGAGISSGTYDYFTQAIVGEEHSSRGDFTSSEDDNVLVQGVSSDPLALGFFGFAYYDENRDKLKAVAIKAGPDAEAVEPSVETIADGTYRPLSRPLFIYVRKDAAENKPVQNFVQFYLNDGTPLVTEVGYVAMPDEAYALVEERFEARTTGSVFNAEEARVGAKVIDVLQGNAGGEAKAAEGESAEGESAEGEAAEGEAAPGDAPAETDDTAKQ